MANFFSWIQTLFLHPIVTELSVCLPTKQFMVMFLSIEMVGLCLFERSEESSTEHCHLNKQIVLSRQEKND